MKYLVAGGLLFLILKRLQETVLLLETYLDFKMNKGLSQPLVRKGQSKCNYKGTIAGPARPVVKTPNGTSFKVDPRVKRK